MEKLELMNEQVEAKRTKGTWFLETAVEVSSAAFLTWFFFLAIQALALQLMTEGF